MAQVGAGQVREPESRGKEQGGDLHLFIVLCSTLATHMCAEFSGLMKVFRSRCVGTVKVGRSISGWQRILVF